MTVRGRKITTLLALCAVLAAMTGLVAASVPLYRLFCAATGYGGTTQVAANTPAVEGKRIITVRFNTDVSPQLPWTFTPPPAPVRVKVGERALVFFKARNNSDHAITGHAVYNVAPDKAGLYFDKIQCFCFTEQRLNAGQEAEMPVSFFVDPAIVKDRNADDIGTITLSYTFFHAADDKGGNKPQVGSADVPGVAAN